MNIGGHVSAKGGIHTALTRAKENNFDVAMFFIGSPSSWHLPHLTEPEVRLFHEVQEKTQIFRTYAHALYLVNLATPDNKLWEQSIHALITTLNNANLLKLKGVIFHIGSHKQTSIEKGISRTISAVQKILSETSGQTKLIIENSVKQGDKVGTSFHELHQIIEEVDPQRVSICYDTCHGFASGYSYGTLEDVEKLASEVKQEIKLSNLTCLHVNDSMCELNGHKDRHANIGEGKIGCLGFKNFFSNKFFRDLDCILEVPGIDQNGPTYKDKESLLDCIN